LIWSAPASAQWREIACEGYTVPDDCPVTPDATSNCGCDWFEDFESYDTGEIPQAPRNDTGGGIWDYPPSASNYWAGWEYVDTVLGTITTDQNRTDPGTQSLRVDQGDDQVHWFLGRGIGAGDSSEFDLLDDGVGYDDDVSVYWIHTGHVFIPNDHTGDHFYIFNSHYQRASIDPNTLMATQWQAQYQFDSTRNQVWDSSQSAQPPPGQSLPLVTGRWTEIRLEINFESDVHLMYYDGNFMAGYQWAASSGNGPDALFLGNIDLYSNQGNYAYYDDLSMIQAEPPPQARPNLECIQKELDQDRCATFVWRLTNMNTEGEIELFWIDVEAGEGGRNPTCRGTATSTTAWTAPPGWTVTRCTGWEFAGQTGHALFQFAANTPGDNIALGATIIGEFTVDTNKSREYERPDDAVNGIAGTTVPAFTVLMSAGQFLGNEAWFRCNPGDIADTFSFGPAQGGAQEWSRINSCEAFLNVPALSTGTKLILAALVLAGGTLLVLRSRRTAAA
jgi:hypothetical protein